MNQWSAEPAKQLFRVLPEVLVGIEPLIGGFDPEQFLLF
jgi:hypothetical protein